MLSNIINSRTLDKAFRIADAEINRNDGNPSFTLSAKSLEKINRIFRISGVSTTSMCDNLIDLLKHKYKADFFILSVLVCSEKVSKLTQIQLTHLN